MKILVATHNKQKLFRYQRLLSKISALEIVSLNDLKISDKAEENYSSNVENAKHKAKFYGDLSGLITIGIDEAAMTNFLPDNEQPGVYLRRFSGDKRELNDDEVVDVWQEIFKKYPQDDKQFVFDYAVAYYNPQSGSTDVMSVKQISHVASNISEIKSAGYPLSRILSPEKNGRPYIELRQEDNWESDDVNFAEFIKKFSEWIEKQKQSTT